MSLTVSNPKSDKDTLGKTMLFGAALGAGWTALAALMAANSAVSLFFYLRVVQPMYFGSTTNESAARAPHALSLMLALLATGTLLTGVLPQPWIAWANQASRIWLGGLP